MRFRDLKKQKNIQKKEQIEINYATYTDRIKAFITDMFMIYAPILYIITYVFLDGKDEFQASQLAPFIGVSMYGIIYALLVSKLAQTPGKKAYIIKIVDAKTHKNISFLRALWRFVAFYLPLLHCLGCFCHFIQKIKKHYMIY